MSEKKYLAKVTYEIRLYTPDEIFDYGYLHPVDGHFRPTVFSQLDNPAYYQDDIFYSVPDHRGEVANPYEIVFVFESISEMAQAIIDGKFTNIPAVLTEKSPEVDFRRVSIQTEDLPYELDPEILEINETLQMRKTVIVFKFNPRNLTDHEMKELFRSAMLI